MVEPDAAGELQPGFAGQLLIVFVQLADQDEDTSLTNAAGHLICFHGPRWLEQEGYALDEGRRQVRYFECYPDAEGVGAVDEVWIEARTAAVRWRSSSGKPGAACPLTTRLMRWFEAAAASKSPEQPRVTGPEAADEQSGSTWRAGG